MNQRATAFMQLRETVEAFAQDWREELTDDEASALGELSYCCTQRVGWEAENDAEVAAQA